MEEKNHVSFKRNVSTPNIYVSDSESSFQAITFHILTDICVSNKDYDREVGFLLCLTSLNISALSGIFFRRLNDTYFGPADMTGQVSAVQNSVMVPYNMLI